MDDRKRVGKRYQSDLDRIFFSEVVTQVPSATLTGRVGSGATLSICDQPIIQLNAAEPI
jgi:hypothetical protein